MVTAGCAALLHCFSIGLMRPPHHVFWPDRRCWLVVIDVHVGAGRGEQAVAGHADGRRKLIVSLRRMMGEVVS